MKPAAVFRLYVPAPGRLAAGRCLNQRSAWTLLGRAAAVATLLSMAGPGHAAAPPKPGIGTGQLCVATLPKAPNCGPAEIDVQRNGKLRIRIDDVVYNLQIDGKAAEVMVMHNAVLIDAFAAPYRWDGTTLHFEDGARHSVYEIRLPGKSVAKP